MIQVWPEPYHARERIVDRAGKRRLARQLRQLGMQPLLQVLDQRLGLFLPVPDPRLRRLAPGPGLDRIEVRDPFDRLFGDRRTACLVDVDELAPDVCHASDFGHGAVPVKLVEPGITVCMHEALIAVQVSGR